MTDKTMPKDTKSKMRPVKALSNEKKLPDHKKKAKSNNADRGGRASR